MHGVKGHKEDREDNGVSYWDLQLNIEDKGNGAVKALCELG